MSLFLFGRLLDFLPINPHFFEVFFLFLNQFKVKAKEEFK